MTSFQDAPDEAIEADEAKEACSSIISKNGWESIQFMERMISIGLGNGPGGFVVAGIVSSGTAPKK